MGLPNHNKKHYAVFTIRTIYIPGDERSRTNPGHGYPEHTEEAIDYKEFSDYELFEKHCNYLISSGQRFKAAEIQPITFTMKIVRE